MRVAVIDCEGSAHWAGWTERLWRKAICVGEHDVLDTYRAFHRCWPNPDTVAKKYDVVVVGGSRHSAYEELQWIGELEEVLRRYYSAGVRLVGCCFGHQLISKALGGRVGRNPSGRFVLGVESVRFDTSAARSCGLPWHVAEAALGGAAAAGGPAGVGAGAEAGSAAQASGSSGGGGGGGACTLRLLQSHGDAVLELPPGATLLAVSDSAAHEMWTAGGRVLCFQFHPEMWPQLVHDKILKPRAQAVAAAAAAGEADARFTPQDLAAAEAALAAGPAGVDSEAFLQMLRAFARGVGPAAAAPAAAPAAPVHAAAAAYPASASEPMAASVPMEVDVHGESLSGAASSGVQAAAAVHEAMQQRASRASSEVLSAMREALAAGLAEGTASSSLLTALNREAAAAVGGAAGAAEGVASQMSTQQDPLEVAMASLGALEAQLDRLGNVVGHLELESRELEQRVAGVEGRAVRVGAGVGAGGRPYMTSR